MPLCEALVMRFSASYVRGLAVKDIKLPAASYEAPLIQSTIPCWRGGSSTLQAVELRSSRLAASARRVLRECLRRDQPPGFMNMKRQFLVVDAIQFDTDPAAHADIRRLEERSRRCADQGRLDAWRSRYPHGDMPIVVMVVGKHREDLFAHEESWLAVRELFCCLGQRHTDSAYSPQMLAIEIKFGIGWRLCHGKPCQTLHERRILVVDVCQPPRRVAAQPDVQRRVLGGHGSGQGHMQRLL